MRAAVLVVALVASVAGIALAQDEMPKDAPPPPPSKDVTPAPAAPAEEPSALPPGTMIDQPVAVLQALDKVTARARRIVIKVGQDGAFGTLSVKVDACRKAPPEDDPESAAFLEITDRKTSGTPQAVFSGWMFASSPALSAMDHPVYDISVIDCASDASTAAASAGAAGH
jgi:hypothetical protein